MSPPQPLNLLDLRQRAQALLPAEVWGHVQQGAHDANHPCPSVFDEHPLTPRPLRPLAQGHTGLTLWGQGLEHPLLVAPLAYALLCHPDGDQGLAMAAAAQGGQSVVSSLASQPLADIVQAHRQGLPPEAHAKAPAAPWFQLYWQGSRQATLALLQMALLVGCPVVVFTVDAPIKPAGLVLPPGVRAVNLPAQPPVAAPDTGSVFTHWMAQAPTWEDLRWLRAQCPVPLLLKGILHVDDALAAITLGCDGLIVSTHGGRVLPGCVSPLQALKHMAPRVAGRVPLLLDSGIRSGRDAFVALQAGASAVLVGRPCLWGLAAQGALGVAQALRILRDELEMTMALMGCATLADIQAKLQA
jgi:4-hydroxymandelate oxidase